MASKKNRKTGTKAVKRLKKSKRLESTKPLLRLKDPTGVVKLEFQ